MVRNPLASGNARCPTVSVDDAQPVTFGRAARTYHYNDSEHSMPHPVCGSSGPNADPVVPRKRSSLTTLSLCEKCDSIAETGINPRDRSGALERSPCPFCQQPVANLANHLRGCEDKR
jgi:hypothetical protein